VRSHLKLYSYCLTRTPSQRSSQSISTTGCARSSTTSPSSPTCPISSRSSSGRSHTTTRRARSSRRGRCSPSACSPTRRTTATFRR
jgi:hypothetical protein